MGEADEPLVVTVFTKTPLNFPPMPPVELPTSPGVRVRKGYVPLPLPSAPPTPARLPPACKFDVPEKAGVLALSRPMPTDRFAPGSYVLLGDTPSILRRGAQFSTDIVGSVEPGAALEVVEFVELPNGDVRARIREGWLTAQKAETGRVSLKVVGGSATGRNAAEDTPSSSRRKSVTLFLGSLLQARDAPAELAA